MKNIQTFEQHSSKEIQDKYPYLTKLFKNLPNIGMEHLDEFGENIEFKGTDEDLVFIHDIIESLGSIGLISRRTNYLIDGGELDIDEWYESIKTEKTFSSYMLNNYNLEGGKFIINKNFDELEKLAEKYFELQ